MDIEWKQIYLNNKPSMYEISTNGDIKRIQTGHIIAKYFTDGCMRSTLVIDKNKQKRYSVARLMLETFTNIIYKSDYMINYKDGNKANLNIKNLEYISFDEYNKICVKDLFQRIDDVFILKSGSLEDEKWKFVKNPFIPEKSSNYMISNYGRLLNIYTMNFLKDSLSGRYPSFSIHFMNIDGKRKSKKINVHRLVAIYFVHNADPINCVYVHHKDNNKLNFFYKNLQWVTPLQNVEYDIESGTNINYGENSSTATITDIDAHNICKMLINGYKVSEISKTLHISRSIISGIKRRKSWTHISSNYIFSVDDKFHIDHRLKDIIELYIRNGYSNRDIIGITGISFTTVNTIRRKIKNDFEMKKEKILESFVLKEYSNGLSVKKISNIYRLTEPFIKRIIKNNTKL